MKIKDVMSKPVQIDKSGRISEALDLMDKHHVRWLVVRHAGKLLGIITLRNVCESLGSRRKSNHPPSLFHVADAVSNSFAVFEPEEGVKLAIDALKDVDSVVVADGDILGAVSTADVIRHVTPDGTVSSVMKMPAIAPPDARVSFIRKMMMKKKGISRVPIMDGATLVGIVSGSDVANAPRGVKRRSSRGHQDNNVERMLALDIMQADVVTAKPDTPLKNAARLMLERGIGALPVVNDDRHLVGIVTRRDIVRAI
jgi:CBS domain-containing protein